MVYLKGLLPSETEHQILIRTLTDVLEFDSITDHLQISELDWEREAAAPGVVDPESTPYEQLLYDEEPYTDDIFESEEDDIPYDLPDKVQPSRMGRDE